MPLKPLQRLAVRPEVARASSAQQWHSIVVRSLHGSCRHPLQAPGRVRLKQRLFDELFPKQPKPPSTLGASPSGATGNENGPDPSSRPAPPKWASQISDELPPLAPSEELRRLSELPDDPTDDDAAFLNSATSKDADGHGNDSSSSNSPALRATTMLILNAASKQLVESDFLRIGAKGQHVPGWVNGIVRVIQGRDQDTLEPQGHYFILFDRHEAAVAYSEEVYRLRNLARRYTPSASHSLRHMYRRHSLPEGLPTDTGEDVASLVKSFTLIPPAQTPRLRIAERLGDERVSELDRGGALVDDIVRAVGGHKHLVMVHVADGGRMALEMLQQAIRADGVERNLPWRVVSLDDGIWPFGHSLLKPLNKFSRRGGAEKADTTASTPSASAEPSAENSADGELSEEITDNINDDTPSSDAADPKDEKPSNEENSTGSKQRLYPRFLIAFTDEPEARRFVRHWHRRELTPSLIANYGDGPGLPRPAKTKRASAAPWEITRILNVTLLW